MFGMLLFGIPAALIAKVKGFKPLRWIPAGLIGLITVMCLKSAKAGDINTAESEVRAKKAGIIGIWMCWLNIVLCIVAVIAVVKLSQ